MADIDTGESLGPLARMLGTWEGADGEDHAPSPGRTFQVNHFRERTMLEPTGLVDNHEQRLYGLRYFTQAWRLGEVDPFHEEVGYWMWDPKEHQVIRCFSIPRGLTVMAGGTVPADAREFYLSAELGSEIYGVCSNKFLHREFRTLYYELKVTFNDDGSFSYDQDTQLWLKGKSEIFHHRDRNTLHKVG
jgi:hypothetical protein